MPGTLVTFHGLPGSGKSTLALRIMEQLSSEGSHSITRVNSDDLRTLLAGEVYHTGNPVRSVEKAVTARKFELIAEGLATGGYVLSDDTHLNPNLFMSMRQAAAAAGARIAHVFVDVPVQVAQERNQLRGAAGGRLVPPFVIERMAGVAYSADGLTIKRELFVEPKDIVLPHLAA